MKYREGVDYWVRELEFPNSSSPSIVLSNGDGTFTILLSTRVSSERRAEGLRHELTHLEREHFYRDELELWEIEAEADGRLRLAAPSERVNVDGRDLPLYEDPDDVMRELLRRAGPGSAEFLRRAAAETGFLPGE